MGLLQPLSTMDLTGPSHTLSSPSFSKDTTSTVSSLSTKLSPEVCAASKDYSFWVLNSWEDTLPDTSEKLWVLLLTNLTWALLLMTGKLEFDKLSLLFCSCGLSTMPAPEKLETICPKVSS